MASLILPKEEGIVILQGLSLGKNYFEIPGILKSKMRALKHENGKSQRVQIGYFVSVSSPWDSLIRF